jgi:hypothetical protein
MQFFAVYPFLNLPSKLRKWLLSIYQIHFESYLSNESRDVFPTSNQSLCSRTYSNKPLHVLSSLDSFHNYCLASFSYMRREFVSSFQGGSLNILLDFRPALLNRIKNGEYDGINKGL